MLTRPTVDLYRPRLALTVKRGLRFAVVAALALSAPATALADNDPLETVVGATAPPAVTRKDAKALGAKIDPKAAKGEGAKDAAKPVSMEEKAARGVVVIERAGQALALGAVLSGDGRILSSLSSLGSGNDLDVRFADGTSVRVKLGHHDRTWDLALLVPQSGRWGQGLIASAREPVRPDATIHAFTLNKGKISAAPIVLRSHRSLLGGDDKPLENAIEIGSRVNPVDLGSPVIDEEGRVVAVLGRGCAPVENRPCTPVAFGAPMTSIKSFLRNVPASAVAPAAWLGIQGVSETSGIAKGVRIISVHPDSPADEAHLKGGEKGASDLILAVDGTPVTSPEALAEVIRAHGIGEKVPLTVFGQGKYHEVVIVLRAAPDAKPSRPAPANPAELPAADGPSAPPATLPPVKKALRR
ncbi:MAG: S1C family serine protease [Byssovorax sp.]